MITASLLLYLRLLELAILIGCYFWISWSPKSRLRNQRLLMLALFVVIDIAAIFIAVFLLKVQLW